MAQLVSTGLIIGGLAALYVLSRARTTLSLGEGYYDSYNITISPTIADISTEIVKANVEYPLTVIPGLIPTIVVPVNYYNTNPGTSVFCRIKDASTGALVTRLKESLILLGGSGSRTFTFMGLAPGGDWGAVMPNAPWNLTIECGIIWL